MPVMAHGQRHMVKFGSWPSCDFEEVGEADKLNDKTAQMAEIQFI